MTRTRSRIMTLLLIVACCMLPGAYIECDCEDGEIEIDFDGFCGGCSGCSDCDDDGFWFDFWWDD